MRNCHKSHLWQMSYFRYAVTISKLPANPYP